MKVRIVYTESATSESITFDSEIAELNSPEVINAIRLHGFTENEAPQITPHSFVIHGDKAALLATSEDSYFGPYIWTAIIYTVFI